MATSILDTERVPLAEAARKVGRHIATLHRWRLNGVNGRKLRCWKVGHRVEVELAELEAFIADLSGRRPGDEPADLAERADAAGEQLTALGL